MLKSIILTIAFVLGLGTTLRAKDRYYMFLFGAQSEPKTVRLSHTFAVFVKASGTGVFPTDYRIETQTISWMPKSLAIQALRQTPVDGVNLSLAETFKWTRSVGMTVTTWGPYRIQPELYAMAARQAKRLNEDPKGHIIFDGRYREDGSFNCIHALSDLDTTQSLLDTGTAYGNDGTLEVLSHFQRYIMSSQGATGWLVEQIGLKRDDVRFASAETTSVRSK